MGGKITMKQPVGVLGGGGGFCPLRRIDPQYHLVRVKCGQKGQRQEKVTLPRSNLERSIKS